MSAPTLLPATHHTTALGQDEICWHSWGDPYAPRCVVLLHGFMGCGLDFESWVGHLGAGWFLAPDMPHHGGTHVRSEASVEWTADLLGRWLEGLGVTHMDLVGYSMGGRVALAGAARQVWPGLQSLALIGASPGLETQQERAQRVTQDERLAASLETHTMEAFLQMWRQKPVIASQRNIPPQVRQRMDARRVAQSPSALARSLRQMGTGRMRPVPI